MRFIYTKSFATFACFFALGALVVVLQLKGLLYPVKNIFLQAPRPVIFVISHTAAPVKNFFSVLYRLRSITEQNSQLQQQNIQLSQSLVLLNQAQSENAALKNELGFAQSTNLQLQPCTVISSNPFGIEDSIVLNCGSGAGVAVGQAVISQGFLVGKVTSVDRNSSIVLLANSSSFSTDAKISKTGATALVHGSFSSGLILDQLSQNDQANKGDLVVTAGIDQHIPKNILIGQIGDLLSSTSDLFKSTTIISPIDLKNLDFVFAVK